MRLSKTELKVLEQIAFGKKQASEIALALNKDISQVYHIIRSLQEKKYIMLKGGVCTPSEITHVNILLQELSRRSSIINNLSGCGIKLYTAILEPRSIAEIMRITGMKRSTIFYKLKEALENNFINTTKNKYFFNEKIWPRVKEFLIELKKYEEIVDKRIPPGSTIYYKTDKEIVFSTKAEYDAALTGFSAYEQFGIKILTVDYTYYLPKKKLTKKEIFLHSLYRAEKTGDARDFILIAIFYFKHKKDLTDIKHKIIENINKILQGEKVKYYPNLAEIKDRADVYDIKI